MPGLPRGSTVPIEFPIPIVRKTPNTVSVVRRPCALAGAKARPEPSVRAMIRSDGLLNRDRGGPGFGGVEVVAGIAASGYVVGVSAH